MVSRRRIPLPLGGFGLEAVEYQAADLGLSPDAFVSLAALWHLHGRGRDAMSFLCERSAETTRVLTVQLEPASWAGLEAEAADRDVTVGQLLAMASLELAADLDAGRVASVLGAGSARAA
jgi:hypothetical protein